MWDLFKVKDVNYNLQNNINVCLNHCQAYMGWTFYTMEPKPTMELAEMKRMNIYNLEIIKQVSGTGMNRCGICVQ